MLGFALLFLALFIVIFIHELGHVVAFRRIGMEVDTMSIGLAWGPRITIKSKLLRRYAGANFTLILSPLVIAGYVKPSRPEQEDELRADEKALVYGGGVIANLLLSIFIYAAITLMVAWNSSGKIVVAETVPLLGGQSIWLILALFGLSALILCSAARFICRFIFPVIGFAVLALLVFVLWRISANPSVLAQGGFIVLADQTEQASALGYFWAYVGYFSVILGLGNLLPLYPLDGGHIAMIHVKRFVPKLEPLYKRLGIVVVALLLVFQFIPDLLYVLS